MKWDDFHGEPVLLAERYIETDIECPKCNQKLWKDTMIIYTSMPVKHAYHCMNEACKFRGVK